jgi:hypothetical protein
MPAPGDRPVLLGRTAAGGQVSKIVASSNGELAISNNPGNSGTQPFWQDEQVLRCNPSSLNCAPVKTPAGTVSFEAYEYTKSQLATSGAPTPKTTISDFPSTPLSDAFDASGDLWVSTDNSVVEFSKADLAEAKPAPTVTISSSGGAQLVFDTSGDLWMVTGGGPYCFGTPCTNDVVELTKAQLSASGSPTPAVTISSTKVGAQGSIYGPYSLAFTSSGDLWVENFDNNTTVEFGRDQLLTSGSPTPLRDIVGPRTGMNFPSYVVIAP